MSVEKVSDQYLSDYSPEIRALPDEELARLFRSADELAAYVSDTDTGDIVQFCGYLQDEICRRFCRLSDSECFHLQCTVYFRDSE